MANPLVKQNFMCISEMYICGICSSRYFYVFPFRNPWIDFVFLFCRMNWPILVVLLERSDRLAQFEQKSLNNMVQNDHLAITVVVAGSNNKNLTYIATPPQKNKLTELIANPNNATEESF